MIESKGNDHVRDEKRDDDFDNFRCLIISNNEVFRFEFFIGF